MTESATRGGRLTRRRETADRITTSAQQLTLEHGLDGFTMDDLADAASVSRRTLFNYFPGKVDAVLGAPPEFAPELLGTFHQGGPHGDLISDLTVLAQSVITVRGLTRADLTRVRRVIRSDPRLMVAAHDRFGAVMERGLEEIRVREGADFDPGRARIAVTVLACLLDQVMDDYLEDPGTGDVAEAYAATVRQTRELFAPR